MAFLMLLLRQIGLTMANEWLVRFSSKAEKQYYRLRKNGSRPCINDVIDLLALELKSKGPERKDWLNYSKLSEDCYHCHLKKGKPTYVACWKVLCYKNKWIEVYYVGTHESAPY